MTSPAQVAAPVALQGEAGASLSRRFHVQFNSHHKSPAFDFCCQNVYLPYTSNCCFGLYIFLFDKHHCFMRFLLYAWHKDVLAFAERKNEYSVESTKYLGFLEACTGLICDGAESRCDPYRVVLLLWIAPFLSLYAVLTSMYSFTLSPKGKLSTRHIAGST